MILLTFDAHYCCNFGNSDKKKSKGILMDAIVAIMTVLKILLIPNDRNCCNYGNFGKKWVNPSDHNCCNYCNSEKKKLYESYWSQLLQLCQFWKLYSWLLMPDAHNCFDFGNSGKK